MDAFDQFRRTYLPPSRLDLRLDPASRRRIIWASLLPGVVVAALLTSVALSFAFPDPELYPGSFGSAPCSGAV